MRELLLMFYFKPFAKELNELCETDYEFNMDNKEEYEREVNECADQKLRTLSIEIKLMEIQVEAERAEKSELEETNYENDFYSTLIELSDFSKIHLTDKITMFEFGTRVAKLQEYIEKLKHNKDGGKPE